jgi:SAM-dependent methyltransferase
MNSIVAARLLALNRDFYDRFGDSFSAARQRLQPGVRRIMESIKKDDSVLDLGCGNGHFLLELSQRGHKAPLLGVDISLPLLREAQSQPAGSSVVFLEIDLTKLPTFSDQLSVSGGWKLITMFAALHHLPSYEVRLDILKTVRTLLSENGKFILSNWQFLNSEKLKSRIQPWSRMDLSKDDVDEGDFLLNWRSGGEGLRYVHHFSAEELSHLAAQAGLRVSESFTSDGDGGRLGLYQVWAQALS